MRDNYDEVIWLIGDGRSGTTWVCELINHHGNYRELFEPFHPRQVPEMRFMAPHQYVRSDDSNERLTNLAADIFAGTLASKAVDSGNNAAACDGLLIKDIFANLLCYWACLKFPNIKPVLLLRNPFAVALSKYRKRNWFWVTEPLDLLQQSALFEDYLSPFEDIIRTTSARKNYILNQVVIWSVINYVPLRQFEYGSLHICFYEDVYHDPNATISKLMRFVRGGTEDPAFTIPQEIISRPSRTVRNTSALLSGKSPVSSWKNELPVQLIDEGLEILQHFGFEGLYDDELKPNRDVLGKIHEPA